MEMVNNRFWHLTPTSSLTPADIADVPVLTSPDGLVAKLSDRDGIVVASWDSDLQQGRVHALGVVQRVDKPRSAVVEWRRVNFAVAPTPQGRSKWERMPFFKFADVVAERYRLADHFHDAFTSRQSATPELTPSEVESARPSTNDGAHQGDSLDVIKTEHAVSREPQCNRVAPDGTIFATPARGTYMGNRADRRRWLVCELEFDRILKAPCKYTKLFFLDEAVALAAGHRPCQTCRRARYEAYMAAIQHTHAVSGAQELDERLNTARKSPHSRASVRSLPDGAFVSVEAGDYRLVWRGALHKWTPHGYVDSIALEDFGSGDVAVLTPEPTLAALHHGYPVDVHSSVS